MPSTVVIFIHCKGVPSAAREHNQCCSSSCEHLTYTLPIDITNQIHISSFSLLHLKGSKQQKGSLVSKCLQGGKSLSRTFYLITQCDLQSSFRSTPTPQTHTLSLFPLLFPILERSFRKTSVLFLMTLILSDQTKAVINLHQEGASSLLNEIRDKSSASLTLWVLESTLPSL